MALATIPLSDADRLPPVCACCGASATFERFETYTWNPRWVNALFLLGVLPWLVLRFATRRAATLRVPACACHAEDDRRVGSILLAGVATGVALAFAGSALVLARDDRGMSVLVCAACVVATAALGAVGVADRLIRAREI